jgi:hypothetical protein
MNSAHQIRKSKFPSGNLPTDLWCNGIPKVCLCRLLPELASSPWNAWKMPFSRTSTCLLALLEAPWAITIGLIWQFP